MKRMAQYGGGFFHHAYDPKTLPQIVLQQMDEKPDQKPPAERDFTPVPVRGSEFLEGFPREILPTSERLHRDRIKEEGAPGFNDPSG